MKHLILKTLASGCLLTAAAFAQNSTLALNALAQPQAVSGSAAAGNSNQPKKPGAVRIGIAEPRFNIGSQPTLTAGEPVRTEEAQLLSGPKVEVVKLAAMLMADAVEEAKMLGCDYILSSSVTQKTTKSALGSFGGMRALSMAASQASMLPKVSAVAGLVSMQVAQNAAFTAMNAVAAGVKAKSDIILEYSLDSLSGQAVFKNTEKAKSQADGQDVITPLVEQAMAKILPYISKSN